MNIRVSEEEEKELKELAARLFLSSKLEAPTLSSLVRLAIKEFRIKWKDIKWVP